MSGRQSTWILAAHLAIAFVVVVAASVLGALHDLDPQAVVAIYGMGVGAVTGSVSALASTASLINGKSLVSHTRMQRLDERDQAAQAVLGESAEQPSNP